jgi:hypothetical protein
MAKNKRWGKIFVDKRDHKKYQEELVKRYEIFIDLDWVSSWSTELIQMNSGKKGKPFEYPDSMIEWQSFLVEKFSTRGAEGITRKLRKYKLIPKSNDHSTIHRRILKKEFCFSIPKGIEIHESTDGSGFKMVQSGEYFQDKYGKTRRKYAKVTITATKDEILAVDVFVNKKGSPSESKIAQRHITKITKLGGNIVKSYNDGAFDNRKFFNFLDKKGIESAIRIRSNATTNAKGSMRRKKETLLFKELGYKKWAQETEYGMRWAMTENKFSGIKITFGDCAKAKDVENILVELKRKVWLYNEMRKFGKRL